MEVESTMRAPEGEIVIPPRSVYGDRDVVTLLR